MNNDESAPSEPPAGRAGLAPPGTWGQGDAKPGQVRRCAPVAAPSNAGTRGDTFSSSIWGSDSSSVIVTAQEPSSAARSPSASSCSSLPWYFSPSAWQVSSDRVVDEDDVDAAGVTGTIAAQIDTALEQPNATRWVAVLVGAFGMALAGRTLSRVMVAASCLSWRQPVRIKASPRLIGALVGLLFGMALIATVVNRIADRAGQLPAPARRSWWCSVLSRRVGAALATAAEADPRPRGAAARGRSRRACPVGPPSSQPARSAGSVRPGIAAVRRHRHTLVTLGWFFILGRAVVISMSLDAVDLRATRQHHELRLLAATATRSCHRAGAGCGATSTWTTHPASRPDRRCCGATGPRLLRPERIGPRIVKTRQTTSAATSSGSISTPPR